VRASKLPYRDFEYNIRRAEALARLDGYLEDLLDNDGKGTVRALLEIPNELMQSLGMDQVMKRVAEEMKKELEVQFQQKGREHYEKAAKHAIKRLRPRLLKAQKMLEDLGFVMDQILLEQALVAAVSAFEVYLKELAVSVTMLNSRIRKRFYPEINRAIDVTKLEEYGQDAERAQGEIVSNLIKLDANSIRSITARLLDLENVFVDRKTERKVCRVFETRNIIIHRAGLTDPKFKKVTKSKGAIDTYIKISQGFVLNSIKTFRNVVQNIETHVHQAITW
jgi:hypothetical protein